jgi:hypothetical protein
VVTRNDDDINFRWGGGAPDPLVPPDISSARWTGTATYEDGTYRMTVTGVDGIRVFVDGTLVLDGWHYQSPTTYTTDVPLTAGQHMVVVEYFKHTGDATAKLSEVRV